jgi:anaerobic magnesium-protoporphyrin IX monomethyl ester cyclase
MNILLVIPRLKNESYGDPPLGLAYLASYLSEKIKLDIDILDTAFLRRPNSLSHYLERNKPDIMGVYFSTATYNLGMNISRLAKKKGAYVVAGGPHATILPETLIQEVDMLVIGEGEVIFTEAIKALLRKDDLKGVQGIWFKDHGKVIKNTPRDAMVDLDHLPFPARDILDMERYINNCQYFDSLDFKLRATTMIASRGCSFACSYCQPTLDKLFGKEIRFRSPDNVISEIKHLRDKYAIQAVFFHDDTLTLNRNWIEGFCKKAISDTPGLIWGCNARADSVDDELLGLMHKAGLRNLHIGAESANQRVLDNIYHKGITLVDIHKTVRIANKRNIRTMCFFMLGAPTETKKEANETIKLARRLPIDEAVFNLVSPMPGTYLYNLVVDMGLAISSNWADFNYYSKSSYKNSTLSLGQVRYLQLKAFFIFYLSFHRLKYILSHFGSFRGMHKLFLKLKRVL